MNPEEIFYLCPTCFEASETALADHEHPMMLCTLGQPGDERRKPATNSGGQLTSRAPRWFWQTLRTTWHMEPVQQ